MMDKAIIVCVLFSVCLWTRPAPVGGAFNGSSAESAGDAAAVADGLNRFAVDLYQELASNLGNIAMAPFSITSALALTWAGAAGETAAEIAAVLHFTHPSDQIHATFSELHDSLESVEGVHLYIANSLFPDQSFSLSQHYVSLARTQYKSECTPLDYRSAPESARRHINRWIEDKTREKIRDMMAPGVIDPLTVMVLANALYYKGDWASQFDPGRTVDHFFTSASGDKQPVRMMRQENRFGYYETDELQLLELPFSDDRIRMVFILPRQRNALAVLETSLQYGTLRQYLDNLSVRTVSAGIPRFTLEWGATNITRQLQKLGMQKAFTTDADFTVMSPDTGLLISMVVHQAFVEINEEGAEAAGATAVVMRTTSMPQRYEFIADHPFIFLIRDKKTGLFLFMGRVSGF